MQAWCPKDMDALLMCIPIQKTVGRKGGGDFAIGDDGRLSRQGDVVYGGAQIIKTDMLRDIDEDVFSLNVVWTSMEAKNSLYGVKYDGYWCDVGHPDGIGLAEDMLEQHDV
jgi:MurNAc alpha-1-phosphate uridylyltransferase